MFITLFKFQDQLEDILKEYTTAERLKIISREEKFEDIF